MRLGLGLGVDSITSQKTVGGVSNLLFASEAMDDTDDWLRKTGATVSANNTNDPNGELTAERVDFAADSNSRIQQLVTLEASTTYTFSVHARVPSGQPSQDFRLRVFGVSGAVDSFTAVSSGWNRFDISFITNTAGTHTLTIINDGDGETRSIQFWGAMLNKGETAGDYVKTDPSVGGSAPTPAYSGFGDEFVGVTSYYSLRQFTEAETLNAVRVRRSSDDTEQDMGFDSNGDLDTTALTTFVNADVDTYTSDFSSTDDLGENNGSGAAAQSVADVDDAYKFTLSGGSTNHFASKSVLFDLSNTYSVSLDYYIPSGQTVNGILIRTGASADGVYNQEVTDAWTSVTIESWTPTISNAMRIYALSGGSITVDADGDVFYLKNIVVTQTTADGHVTRWYSQSNPVDTYTSDFTTEDGFSGTTNNTASALTSVTDDYGTTIDNVLQLNCDNTTSDEHVLRKLSPLPTTGSIANLTLRCSFKMLVPSSNTTLVGASLSDGNQTTAGIVSDGKLTEQGRWTTFTDVAWTQINQSRILFMGLDASDNVTFSATEDDKFYIADVVLNQTTDTYNATSTEQPLIVDAGNVVTENSKPAIKFDGVDDKLGFASNLNIGGSPSIIGVLNIAAGDIAWRGGSSDYWYFQLSQIFRYRNGDFDATWINSDGLPAVTGSQKLIATYKNATSVELAVDGTSIATKSSGTGTDGAFNNIGSDALNMDGVWQELIIFTSDQSSNRTGIESNINDHFNIYTP